MTRRARHVLLAAAAGLVLAAIGLFVWLPWNPFEEDAGPLDAWIPLSAEIVVRLDPSGLRKAPGALALWNGQGGRRLRADLDLDSALDAVGDLDRRLARNPLAGSDPLTVLRDLAGREVLLAAAGDDVLVMTRISGRAKAVDLLRRADDARLASLGLSAEGGGFVAERDGRAIRFARRRDVLLLSTSRSLLDAAIALADGGADGGAGSLLDRRDFRENRPPVPSGARAGAWVKGDVVRRFLDGNRLSRRLTDSARAEGVRIEADLGSSQAVTVLVHVRDGSEMESRPSVAPLVRSAERFAPRGSTIAAGGFVVDPQDAVAALVDAQPPARRKLLDDLLAERGSSLPMVVRDIASHLAPGAGFVVARLPETDEMELDDPDGDLAEPIPATLAVFRLADAAPDALLADLQKHAEALFGTDSRLVEEAGPGGARVLRADASGFGPEWRLLTPALALVGDEVVFTSNTGHLLRSLASPSRGEGESPSDVACIRIEGDAMRARLRDLRWEHADRVCRHDWAAERRAIRAEFDRHRTPISPEDRKRREDDEIARRMRVREEVEFPRALAARAESLRWLEQFTRLTAQVTADAGGGATFRVEIGMGRR